MTWVVHCELGSCSTVFLPRGRCESTAHSAYTIVYFCIDTESLTPLWRARRIVIFIFFTIVMIIWHAGPPRRVIVVSVPATHRGCVTFGLPRLLWWYQLVCHKFCWHCRSVFWNGSCLWFYTSPRRGETWAKNTGTLTLWLGPLYRLSSCWSGPITPVRFGILYKARHSGIWVVMPIRL